MIYLRNSLISAVNGSLRYTAQFKIAVINSEGNCNKSLMPPKDALVKKTH